MRIGPIIATASTMGMVAAMIASHPVAAQRATRQQHIDVGVSRNEAPVPNLTLADFVVREDGVSREVLGVGPAPPPSHIALLVDDSEAIQPLVADVRTGLSAFVRAFEDHPDAPAFSVMTFGERPTRVLDSTTSIPAVLSAANRVFARAGAGAYLLDAILETCKDFKKKEAARPVILAFVSEGGPEFSNETHDRIAQVLKEVHASLWAVILQSQEMDMTSREARERAAVLGDESTKSGGLGKTVISRQGIVSGFRSVAGMILSRYDVTYGRPESMLAPAKFEVEVKQPNVRVLAPRWNTR
jgi:hypothetical protein